MTSAPPWVAGRESVTGDADVGANSDDRQLVEREVVGGVGDRLAQRVADGRTTLTSTIFTAGEWSSPMPRGTRAGD